MVEPERQVAAGQRLRGTARVDVVPTAGPGLALGLHRRTAREHVAAEPGDRHRPRAGELLRPAERHRLRHPVHRQRVGARRPQVAVLHHRLHRDAVRAGDARAQADHRIVQQEPGLPARQRRRQPAHRLPDRRVGAVARPARPHAVRAGRAPRAARRVREPLRRHRRPRQPVRVDGRPEGVRVLPVAGRRVPPGQQAVVGVPAAHVLAVAGLVEGGARRAHRQRHRPARTAHHRPVHREHPRPHRLRRGRRRAVRHQGLRAGQFGHVHGRVRQVRTVVVAGDPALHRRPPPRRLRGRRRARVRQPQDVPDDGVAAAVVVLLKVQQVRDLKAPAAGPAHHRVHHQAVEQERRVRRVDGVEHVLPLRIRHLPGRPRQQREQPAQPAQQHLAVRPGVRHPGVLHERAVRVQAVARQHVREHRRQRRRGRRQLGRAPADHAAQREDAAQVDAVRAGAGAGVRRDPGVRDGVVHGGRVGTDLSRRQLRGDQRAGVEQRLRRTDLPVPPVVVHGGRRRVRGGAEPVQARRDRRGEGRVAGQSGAGLRPGERHGAQAHEAAGDVRGHRSQRQVRPERARRRGHRLLLRPCAVAEGPQGGGEGLGGRVEPRPGQQRHPAQPERLVRVGGGRAGRAGAAPATASARAPAAPAWSRVRRDRAGGAGRDTTPP
ncbi:hypothetical protein KCH_08490 [Kitasatospora cheerisanensis KCTC 2395]|uniref:Uncharacterized protein n=1 Tax=Kitasatospora cheerisanensis KCTC 2395 TaxID=1348663 RepID=A0A066Z1S7_9ACTN|nr:hypothetical protein KCH_08490 [Kitasatospora cheerisanensis KCTC 2395]